jgi:GNAT superfamily N-acetyltransferase
MNSREIEILAYGEAKQKDSLLPLLEQAFGWTFSPAKFEKSIRTDSRLRDGSVGFCAVKEGRVVGYVGVMDLTLGTASGTEERVGGVYGVATHPEYTRQGISTALLARSHEYFMMRGYRFSLLTTSPTIVAHALYTRLGYFDVAPFLSAYLGARPKRQKVLKRRSSAKPKPDHSRMLELFRQCVKGRTGFVVRDEEYLRRLFKDYEISAKECVVTERGYVIFKKEKESVRIRELVARNGREMLWLIGLVEGMTQKPVVGRLGIPSSGDVIHAYKSRGFTVLEKSHGVLMAKQLVAGASFNDRFGNRFCMSALDHF